MMLRICLFLSALLMAWPAFADTRVVVPNRDIARGETIRGSDLVYGTIQSNPMFSGIATTMADLDGMEARRMLRAGTVVRISDVRRPIIVTKGDTVTMTFEAPGVSLTATGRAMSEGGIGDTITVQNPVSFRQISCVVIGPGAVRAAISPASPAIALAR